ncbi:Phage protein [Lunatimonas lonarensis]|uniref:Phage protein n=1 Tax=Lunatimonas lonarensis TaxID=1232681 RepID=R7ZWG4_9BACT|nr:tail fiber protein [Lunatimonas lonarensis]EON78358.1 Phage protein [Lunatimonas lonarensis]
MKKALLILLLTAHFFAAYSQMIANEAGIGIQGIARDANNNARSNENITLRFTLYYISEDNAERTILSDNETLQTDAFGVFSYVLEVDREHYPLLAYYEAFLKIEEGPTVISDEKLKQVPYALSAGNGVPTGSIMPFIGETAPHGWVLCQGQDISNVPGSARLRNLLGTAMVPDLRGMFLRGTGQNPTFGRSGPGLLQTQEDQLGAHTHEAGEDMEATGGQHQHNFRSDGAAIGTGAFRSINNYIRTNGGDMTNFFTQMDGAHTHKVEGNTAETGGEETRPMNMGVNYIIKL